jgi:hypothetical protein
MKAILLAALLLSCALVASSPAQICREVVRDSSGRIVQTIDCQSLSGGAERAVIRDTSGRIIGTATTSNSGGSSTHTQFRDASGRLTGSAVSQGSAGGSSRTAYWDASGSLAGNASTNRNSGIFQRHPTRCLGSPGQQQLGQREVPRSGGSPRADIGSEVAGLRPLISGRRSSLQNCVSARTIKPLGHTPHHQMGL